MNTIAADTSSQALAVAVKTPNYSESRIIVGKSVQHSEKLVPTIIELCSNAGITTKDIDLLACTRGPGSFTGLRIGMAALKGMALALDKPLVSVPTMDVLAGCVPCFDGAVVTVIDAKKKRWYLGAFEKDEKGNTKRLLADTDGTEADLLPVLEPYSRILVAGPDSQAFACVLEKLYEGKKTIIADRMSTSAVTDALIRLATEKYEKDGADDIGQGPVYLRKSDAEEALEQRTANGEKNNG